MRTSWSGRPTTKVVSSSLLIKRTGSERSNVGVRNGGASCSVWPRCYAGRTFMLHLRGPLQLTSATSGTLSSFRSPEEGGSCRGLASGRGLLTEQIRTDSASGARTEKQSPVTLTRQLAQAEPTAFSALQTYSPRSNFVVLLSFSVATFPVKSTEQRSEPCSFLPALNQAAEISGVPSTRHRSSSASPSFISTRCGVSTKDGGSGSTSMRRN